MTAARSIGSGTISFGLVSIPFKLYTATSTQNISFNMLHDKCNSRMKQQYLCPIDNEVVERDNIVKGYEYAKNQYVKFTAEELKKLEPAKTDSLEIVEFVPETSVDLVYMEKSYYIGPDKGGDRAYQLFSQALKASSRVAVGRYWTHGRVQLVLIKPYHDGGLIMHYSYYASEVRAFEGIAPTTQATFRDVERDLASQLIASLSSETFDPNKYRDEYLDRVRSAIDQKVAGKEISLPDAMPPAQIMDLFEALKRSIERKPQPQSSSSQPQSSSPSSKTPSPTPTT